MSFGKTTSNRLGHMNEFPTIILNEIEDMAIGSRHGLAWNNKI
jgi:hypothetical protein